MVVMQEPAEVSGLQQRIRAVQPNAYLVLPRLLRRVIKFDRAITGPGLRVPHYKTYVVQRETLLEIVDPDELGLTARDSLARLVILLARPEPDEVAHCSKSELFLRYWRFLFHARVDMELKRKVQDGELTPAVLRERIHRIGQTEFDEMRAVLRHEEFLLPPRDDEVVYSEFVAVYLELRYFAKGLLPYYFPASGEFARIEAAIAEDLDSAALFRETRLEGAPDPMTCQVASLSNTPMLQPAALPSHQLARYAWRMQKLVGFSDRAVTLGNLVRAAILRLWASRLAGIKQAETLRGEARALLFKLCDRLRVALRMNDSVAKSWRLHLPILLEPAAAGVWSMGARMLYDLQNVCLAHERDVYYFAFSDWFLSLGRRLLRRKLPNQREVLMTRHLRGALRRLASVRMPEENREQLEALLQDAVHHTEETMRGMYRPLISDALLKSGLQPRNVPEWIAFDKLVAELLDRIVHRGFFTIGDLRDAISRNNLKVADLSDTREFFAGDQLLRADKQLAHSLAGVYRRGEFYLRWLQSFTSLGFGTIGGRAVMRHLGFPFAGTYFGLMGLYLIPHEIQKIGKLLFGPPAQEHSASGGTQEDDPHAPNGQGEAPTADDAAEWDSQPESLPYVEEHHEPSVFDIINPSNTVFSFDLGWGQIDVPLFVPAGMFTWGLLHFPRFRVRVSRILVQFFTVIRKLIWDWPKWLLERPILQKILRSWAFLRVWRLIIKPAIPTIIAWYYLRGTGEQPGLGKIHLLGVFLSLGLLLNSRVGRDVEETTTDQIMRLLEWVRAGLIIGMVRLIFEISKRVVEGIEQLLYAVDERLRFRSGESRFTMIIKPIIALPWALVTYLVRFVIIVLLEPQVNPIKHFPVVTVSHKLTLPLIPSLGPVFEKMFNMDRKGGLAAATTFLAAIPGVFGFLVWELKENWRLYAANRPSGLRPVLIGSHGETMLRFLKPGFHSGTVPKLYARLRRAERHALRGGDKLDSLHYRDALHHVAESVERFVDRELVRVLSLSHSWEGAGVQVADVTISSNRIRIALACPERGDIPFAFAFDEISGWLVARVLESGWAAKLIPRQEWALTTALAGLYKLAGVDLIHEHVMARLPGTHAHYDLGPDYLVVWPRADYQVEIIYYLDDDEEMIPYIVKGEPDAPVPSLEMRSLFYRYVEVNWHRWVATWEADIAGEGTHAALLPGIVFLPPHSIPTEA